MSDRVYVPSVRVQVVLVLSLFDCWTHFFCLLERK